MKIESVNGGNCLRVWAPAKINLFFEILGKRADGYHEIETVAAPISLYDRLDFERTDVPGLQLECFDENGFPDASIPCDERNLVYKAYLIFLEEFSNKTCDFGIKCKIFKKIPTKAGLGGGSSDAAAALLVLAQMSGAVFTKERLQTIGSRIGSDVALFFENGASVGRGRGEIVEPIDLPSLPLVLLKPTEGLSTPAVYKKYAEARRGERRTLDEFCFRVMQAREVARAEASSFDLAKGRVSSETTFSAVESIAAGISNRLEEPASALWDGFESRRTLLRETGALAVQMSGSGTAFFAIYRSEREASEAGLFLSRFVEGSNGKNFLGDRIYVARTLRDV